MPSDPTPSPPTPEDLGRDLAADLRDCLGMADMPSIRADSTLLDAFSKGWPTAIRRALSAEADKMEALGCYGLEYRARLVAEAEAARLRARLDELEDPREPRSGVIQR